MSSLRNSGYRQHEPGHKDKGQIRLRGIPSMTIFRVSSVHEGLNGPGTFQGCALVVIFRAGTAILHDRIYVPSEVFVDL